MKKIILAVVMTLTIGLFTAPAFACWGDFCKDVGASAFGWGENDGQTSKFQTGPNSINFEGSNSSSGGLYTHGNATATVNNLNNFSDERYFSGTKGEALFSTTTENAFELKGRSTGSGRMSESNAGINQNHDVYGSASFSNHGFRSSLDGYNSIDFNGCNTEANGYQATTDRLQTSHINGRSDTTIYTNTHIDNGQMHTGHR